MKRIQKGFTLIELIIVLAIFGIILALVMSFIDPVAKIMSKASIREKTAAYVDNIGEYIDNSLHYAEFMRVYNGGMCDSSDVGTPVDEDEAVKQLLEACLNGAVDKNGVPLKGKARVLKLINTPYNSYKEGHVYETVYNFKCGDWYEKEEGGAKVVEIDSRPDVSIDGALQDIDVINPEHFEEYCYYYKIGFYTLDNIDDPTKYETDPPKSFAPTNRTHYSALNPILDKFGTELKVSQATGTESLCVNVVAYENGNKEDVVHTKADGLTEDIPIFKSPTHLTAASMSLVNVIGTHDTTTAIYTRYKRNATTGDFERKADGSKIFEGVAAPLKPPYAVYNATSSPTDNIYIVFIMPEEILDTKLEYK